jgi:putative FmdB family regulatory protein
MPTYEYQCKDCNKKFDAFIELAKLDKTRPACPKCGKRKVTRLMSGFAAQTDRKS